MTDVVITEFMDAPAVARLSRHCRIHYHPKLVDKPDLLAEPLTAAAGAKFRGIRNLILTPHIAGLTAESNARVSDLAAGKVTAHLEKFQ